jgi:hypothetical protein
MTKSPVKSRAVRHPAPQVVVGLAAGVVELDRAITDDDRVVVVDDVIGPQVAAGMNSPVRHPCRNRRVRRRTGGR